MKKGSLKRFLAGTAMGLCVLAMPFGLIGCNGTKDSIDIDEVKELLNEYIEIEKSSDSEEILNRLINDYYKMAELSLTQNFTYIVSSETETRYARVEYISNDLTKVYFYTINEQGQKVEEIYREITNDTVVTYVKDLSMYSVVPIYKTRDKYSLYTFYIDRDIAYVADPSGDTYSWYSVNNKVSQDFIGWINYDADVPKMFINAIDGLNKQKELINYTYENVDGANIYSSKSTYFVEGDDHDFQYSGIINSRLEVRENSIKISDGLRTLSEKPSSKQNELVGTEIIFDKDNVSTINFEKSNYALVSGIHV